MEKPNYSGAEFFVSKKIIENARLLRQEGTEAEKILWSLLRNRQVNNYKFRRQHALPEGYILDFYCAETKVAIELDGQIHKDPVQKEKDVQRQKDIFEKYGIRIIRFWNGEVRDELVYVLNRIVKFSRNVD